MSAGQSAEIGAIGEVRFRCDYCDNNFAYTPSLRGADLGVQISVQRVGDECVSHTARVVDQRTSPESREADRG